MSGKQIAVGIALGLAVLWSAFPISAMFLVAVRPERSVLAPNLWPESLSLEGFTEAFQSGVLRYVWNSLVLAVGATALALVLALGLSGVMRRPTHLLGSGLRMTLYWIYTLPTIVVAISYLLIVLRMGINQRWIPLIVGYAALMLPLLALVLSAALEQLPEFIREAGRLDGGTSLRTLLRLEVPACRGALITGAVFGIALVWDDFTFGRLLIRFDSEKTFSVAIQDLYTAAVVDWRLIMATGLIGIVGATLLIALVVVALATTRRPVTSGRSRPRGRSRGA